MKKFSFLCLLLALMCSCGGLQRISVEEVRGVSVTPSMSGTIAVTLEAKVNNPSCRKVQLTRLDLTVEQSGSTLATISATQKVVVPRHSDDFQPVPLEVRLRNMLGFAIALQQKNFSPDNLMLSGEIIVKTFPMRKKIKVEKQSVKDFTTQYGDFITPLLKLGR